MRRLIALLGLAACNGEQEPAPVETPNPLGFARWEQDFPVAVPLSPRIPGRWYRRTRRQALEKVIANLQGNCSREAWQFAKDFFDRAPEDAVAPLIETMDRAFLSPALGALVQNSVEAMGRMQDGRFADALLRAMEHNSTGVREAAIQALAASGTPDAVWAAYSVFPMMDMISRRHLLEGARVQLGSDAVALFTELLESGDPAMTTIVVEQAMKMTPANAAAVLEPIFADARGELRVSIAELLHRTGDGRGTVVLREALRSNDSALQQLAVGAIRSGGDPGPLLEDLLRLTIDRDPVLRAAAASALADLPGDHITEILRVLAADPDGNVRMRALQSLMHRGNREEMDRLLAQMRTATGTALTTLLNTVVITRDGQAVPVLLERFQRTQLGEGRGFLQAIAQTRAPEAFGALSELFMGEERPVEPPNRAGEVKTTLNYIPVLMRNVRGADAEMVALFRSIPDEDVERRSYMLDVLGQVAADVGDPAVRGRLFAVLREVLFDRSELPQLRLQTLNYLRRDLTLDDAMQLKRSIQDEELAMGKALSDFLFDLF